MSNLRLNRSFSLLLFIPLLWSCVGNEQVRVLFVGNSRIYFHDQPAILQSLAEANGRDLSWEMHVRGGATLRELMSDALATIRAGDWDAVVVNEQSTWGLSRFVEGATRVPEAPEQFFESVDSFAQAAHEIGAEILLVAHPRFLDMPVADGDRLIRAFAQAAKERESVRIVPLETAWRLAESSMPRARLYEADGNHPSPTGALLSAMSMYRVLFDKAPTTVPSEIRGPFVEPDDGILWADSIVTLVSGDSSIVAILRRAVEGSASAWERDVEEAIRGGDDSTVPSLPSPSREIDVSELQGEWAGDLLVYPRFITWPAAMSIHLSEREGRWTTSLRVSFGGSPSDVYYPELPVSDEGQYLQFLDPDGPNGGYLRYRLVPVGDSLRGIAEFSNDGTVYGIGTLSLRRIAVGEPE